MGAKTLLSLEEFLALPDDGNKYELNQGELVVAPSASREHSDAVRQINLILSKFVNELRLGKIYSEPGCQLSGGTERTIRQPDVAFYLHSRIKAMAPGIYFQGAPDLAV